MTGPQANSSTFTRAQWGIVLVVASLQFVNVLDFVIVMPIGPRLADALNFPASHVPWMNGSYTAAASLTGLLGALFLDRFDRRKAVGVAIAGLVLGTMLCGFAKNFEMLLFSRALAGCFGGPATSLSFAIIADTIPSHVRGKAMGTVMGAFSVASVIGVPTGLWLAQHFGWPTPFFAVAAIGLLILVVALVLLPPMRGHLGGPRRTISDLIALLKEPNVRLSYSMTATVMAAGFVLIPNIASYLQFNLGVPEENINLAYFFGGGASLVATQVGGRLVDSLGSFRVGTAGTLFAICVVFVGFYLPRTELAPTLVYLLFASFMLANGLRNVSYNTLTTKVPDAARRATFQSLQSAVQHAATAVAAFSSGFVLSELATTPTTPGRPHRVLQGMQTVSLISICLSLLIPFFLRAVEQRVALKDPKPERG